MRIKVGYIFIPSLLVTRIRIIVLCILIINYRFYNCDLLIITFNYFILFQENLKLDIFTEKLKLLIETKFLTSTTKKLLKMSFSPPTSIKIAIIDWKHSKNWVSEVFTPFSSRNPYAEINLLIENQKTEKEGKKWCFFDTFFHRKFAQFIDL